MSHPSPLSSFSLFGGGGVGLISSTLRSLVELAFGPSGSDAILQTSATSVGKVVITNSGESILKQTQVEHPIAKLIVDAVDQHGRAAGDGSVTVVLQLAASMEEALHFTQGQLGIGPNATSLSPSLLRQSHLRRHRLISSLKQIHRHWIVNGALERWLIDEKSSPIPQNDDNMVRLAVTHIICTMMGNKLSASAASHLSTALVELIFQSRLTSATPLHTVCTDLLHDFAFVHCPGLPFTESKPLHGLVCPGRVAVRGMATELQATKVLILHGEFHSTPMKHEVAAGRMVFETTSTEATMAFLTAGEQFIRRWVERLRRDGVALVLSSRTIHDATLGLLHEAGITAVHGMDEYDTRRIAKYTRTVPVSSLERFEDTPLPLGQLAAFTQIMVGGQVMLHAEMDIKSVVRSSSSMHVPDLIRGHTLLVCGASDGMCRQYANLLTRGLTLIREWSFGSIEYGRQLAHNGGTSDVTSVSPLYVTGGGCSVELSLLMFLSDQARRSSASLTAPLHPLVPPSLTGGVIEPFAWRLLERSVESVIRSLLVNGHASGQSSSFSSSTLTRPTPMPWLKMLPHLRILHERSGLRNFGFNFNAIALNGNTQPFRPLFEMIRPSSSVRTLVALQELQLAVGTSEFELLSLLPSLFTIGDTLTSASMPLFESPFTKVHVWATCLSLVLTLLRIDEMVVVKSVPSSSNSIAALNRTPGRSRDRKRIQPRRDWNDDDDDSEQENENDESSDDSDHDD